jgi:hypothetical protein
MGCRTREQVHRFVLGQQSLGLVHSLARPGGNLTGFSLFLGNEISSKWPAVPNISRVAVLNPAHPAVLGHEGPSGCRPKKLGVELRSK